MTSKVRNKIEDEFHQERHTRWWCIPDPAGVLFDQYHVRKDAPKLPHEVCVNHLQVKNQVSFFCVV